MKNLTSSFFKKQITDLVKLMQAKDKKTGQMSGPFADFTASFDEMNGTIVQVFKPNELGFEHDKVYITDTRATQ